jgi:hypothetical protein
MTLLFILVLLCMYKFLVGDRGDPGIIGVIIILWILGLVLL